MKKLFLLFVFLCTTSLTFAQNDFGIKLEPLGIPFGIYQVTGEAVINDKFTTGVELSYMNLETSFVINDHRVAEGIGLFGRYYFANEAANGNFLQFYARFLEYNYLEDGERIDIVDNNMVAADIGFGRQIRWGSISFDPFIGAGILGDRNFDSHISDSREYFPYGIVSLDLGYWF